MVRRGPRGGPGVCAGARHPDHHGDRRAGPHGLYRSRVSAAGCRLQQAAVGRLLHRAPVRPGVAGRQPDARLLRPAVRRSAAARPAVRGLLPRRRRRVQGQSLQGGPARPHQRDGDHQAPAAALRRASARARPGAGAAAAGLGGAGAGVGPAAAQGRRARADVDEQRYLAECDGQGVQGALWRRGSLVSGLRLRHLHRRQQHVRPAIQPRPDLRRLLRDAAEELARRARVRPHARHDRRAEAAPRRRRGAPLERADGRGEPGRQGVAARRGRGRGHVERAERAPGRERGRDAAAGRFPGAPPGAGPCAERGADAVVSAESRRVRAIATAVCGETRGWAAGFRTFDART